MTEKYFDGHVMNRGVEGELDADLRDFCVSNAANVVDLMDKYRAADALSEIMRLAGRANRYVDLSEPWNLAKLPENRARLETALYNLLEAIRFIATLLAPFIPESAEKIAGQIGADIRFASLEEFGVKEEFSVKSASALFARLDVDEKIKQMSAELASNAPPESPKIAPIKEEISIDDFCKLDIRVGRVLSCEKVPKSAKLLKFTLEVGPDTRQILSGISKYYAPEDLLGKNVLFIANLKPVKMMGLESNGMILSASIDGNVSLATVMNDIASGAEVV
jgi:methionyl-tRNA synthetase